MNKICILLCLLSLPLLGLNSKIFYARLRTPTPAWMVEQIEEDLSRFTHELSRKSIDELFAQEGLYLVRVRVKDGQLQIQKSSTAAQHPTPDQVIPHLHTLHSLVPLTDIDFVFSAHDAVFLTAPILCITKVTNGTNDIILMPDWFALRGFEPEKTALQEGNRLYPWETKQSKIFYRGKDSGIQDRSVWLAHPRTKLVAEFRQYPDLVDAKFTDLYWTWHTEYAQERGFMGPFVSMKDHPRYKYIINVDANCATTPRVPLILFSNSVLFKNTTHSVLWFFRAIKPYEHYIPVAEDLSDLLTQIEWAKSHDDACKKISENGRRFASESLTHEAVYLYLYRLLQAYAEKQKLYYE